VPALLEQKPVERGGRQTARAYAGLRQMLVEGRFAPGDRLLEETMVDRIGVSRTPLRAALVRLEQEGMLEALPAGGFAVRGFAEAEVVAAIEIRGTLEGLAARFAAERRPSARELQPLRECLRQTERALEPDFPSLEAKVAAYAPLNDRFHAAILRIAGSRALARQIERASMLPFASSSALLLAQAMVSDLQTYFIVAQDQHQSILDAIARHEGARAESLMREHARLASRNLGLILRRPEALAMVPGAALITLQS
jgi:GntR family transcriptional regulator of vanillate catabolism